MAVFKKIAIRGLIDFLSLIFVFLPWIVLQIINKPYIRGFFCNDESIKYSFKENTVTNAFLSTTAILGAFIVIFIVEIIRHYLETDKEEKKQVNVTSNILLPRYFLHIYNYFIVFLFGLAFQQTFVNIGKYTIGRLRPHFIDVCRPELTDEKCTKLLGGANVMVYLEDYKCLGNPDLSVSTLTNARLSFPSGHSSMACYAAIYIVIYIHCRYTWKIGKLFKHFLQAIFLYMAFYVCLSRVIDNKHHPTDVMAGAAIGILAASIATIHISGMFNLKDYLLSQLVDSTTSTHITSSSIQSGPSIIEDPKTDEAATSKIPYKISNRPDHYKLVIRD